MIGQTQIEKKIGKQIVRSEKKGHKYVYIDCLAIDVMKSFYKDGKCVAK